jgi:hypothetical protein
MSADPILLRKQDELPSNPPDAGTIELYVGADGKPKQRGVDGVEKDLGGTTLTEIDGGDAYSV